MEHLRTSVQSATALQKMLQARLNVRREQGGGWKYYKPFALKLRHGAWQVPDATDERDRCDALLLQRCSGIPGIFACVARAVLGPAYDFLEFLLNSVAHCICFRQATEGCAAAD